MIGALWAQLSGQPLRDSLPVTRDEMVAYFPQAWAFKVENLQACFQDIPKETPELVKEMLRPWPERSLLSRFYGYLRSTLIGEKAANDCYFSLAAPTRKPLG
jgi:hypothetical protein